MSLLILSLVLLMTQLVQGSLVLSLNQERGTFHMCEGSRTSQSFSPILIWGILLSASLIPLASVITAGGRVAFNYRYVGVGVLYHHFPICYYNIMN